MIILTSNRTKIEEKFIHNHNLFYTIRSPFCTHSKLLKCKWHLRFLKIYMTVIFVSCIYTCCLNLSHSYVNLKCHLK